MAKGAELPSLATLQAILEYEPETGRLLWKERAVEMFKDGAIWTADQVQKRWNTRWAGKEAFTCKMRDGHKQGAVFNKLFLAHRVAFKLFYGHDPIWEVDHINGDPSDNRIINLRDVCHKENMRNLKVRRNNSSGLTGIRYDAARNKWVANVGKKRLGRFERVEDAILVRSQAEAEYGYHENHGKR